MAYLDGGALTKRAHPGLAAHAGIVAAHLAAEGVTGPPRIFEGEQGFFRAYAGGGEPARATAGLGSDWETLAVAVKPHACCRHNHAAIDATLEIVRRHDLAPREVVAILAEIPTDPIRPWAIGRRGSSSRSMGGWLRALAPRRAGLQEALPSTTPADPYPGIPQNREHSDVSRAGLRLPNNPSKVSPMWRTSTPR
jgi:hypothetical protein